VKKYQLLFTLATIIAFTFAVAGQIVQPTPPPVEDDGDVIKVNSRLVVIPVSVTDASGQPVLGLKAQDFRVAEES